MLVIGLTGGIGSGKSTVAARFANKNIPVIDADIIARELTSVNRAAYFCILEHFGKTILLPDGNIDRNKLRQFVFTQIAEKNWLENLLHPLIKTSIVQQIQLLKKSQTTPYVVVVIPLLIEVGSYDFINRIVVVDLSEQQQIHRVQKRDANSEQQVAAILKAQIDREERLKWAHDIITNQGDMTALDEQVDRLHEKYLKLSQQDNS